MKITIDSTAVTPFPHFWETVFGSEGAYYPARQDLQGHFRRAHEAFGTRYMRFHGILHDANLLYFEDDLGRPYYHFDGVDRCYDPLVAMGMRPFVELSFMPVALARAYDSIFAWQGITAPPRDVQAWEQLIAAFTRHCVDRYGLAEVRQWYFEVWNEANLHGAFWTGTQQDYWELYAAAARAVKSVDAELRVGGPASAGAEWVAELLAYCAEQQAPIDFVSYHGYPTDEGYVVGGEPMAFKGPGFWREAAARNQSLTRTSAFPQVEIHVTEWNSSPGSRDETHDTTFGAAYVCQAIDEVAGYVDSFSYWTVSDIFQEGGYPMSEFHGGFGLLTIHGIRKPSWYAFALLHCLGTERLATTIDGAPSGMGAIATRSDRGVQALSWHFIQPPDDTRQSEPVVTRIPLADGEYRLTEHLIAADHGDPLTRWHAMGRPEKPDATQLAELHACEPAFTARRIHVTGGNYTDKATLIPGSVRLVELEKMP